MVDHLHKPSVSRPRPQVFGSDVDEPGAPGGEGGNLSSRLAASVGPNTLLVVALMLSATLVGLAAVALR